MNGSLAYGKGNSVPDSENSMCKGPEVDSRMNGVSKKSLYIIPPWWYICVRHYLIHEMDPHWADEKTEEQQQTSLVVQWLGLHTSAAGL